MFGDLQCYPMTGRRSESASLGELTISTRTRGAWCRASGLIEAAFRLFIILPVFSLAERMDRE